MHVLVHALAWGILFSLASFTYSLFKEKKTVKGIIMAVVTVIAFVAYGIAKKMGL